MRPIPLVVIWFLLLALGLLVFSLPLRAQTLERVDINSANVVQLATPREQQRRQAQVRRALRGILAEANEAARLARAAQ